MHRYSAEKQYPLIASDGCTYIQHEVGVGVDEPHDAKQQKLVTQHLVGRLVTKHQTHYLVSLGQTLTTTSVTYLTLNRIYWQTETKLDGSVKC